MVWLSTLLGRPPVELAELACKVDRQRMTPIFLPHLQGERAPIWNPHARASFSGIDAATGPAEFTVAMMEGVAYSAGMAIESLQRSAGTVPLAFSAAGGGMRSDIWCQIRADVLGKPLLRRKNLDAGVLGAAVLAGAEAGLFHSLSDASAQLVVTERIFEPDLSLRERYAYGYAKYKELYQQLEAFNLDLVSVS
jgi:xylulokinase